jgi:hypothetical protein
VIKAKNLEKAAHEDSLALNELRKAENKEKIKNITANREQSDSSTTSSVVILSKRKRSSIEVI